MRAVQAVPGSEEYQARIDEIQDELRNYQANPRSVRSPEELEELERVIRELSEELAALITGRQIQYSLDCEQMHEAQSKLAGEWPHRLEHHESEGVWVRTANGYEIVGQGEVLQRKRQTRRQEAVSRLLSRVTVAGNKRALHLWICCRGESVGCHAGLVGGGQRCAGPARG